MKENKSVTGSVIQRSIVAEDITAIRIKIQPPLMKHSIKEPALMKIQFVLYGTHPNFFFAKTSFML